MRSVGVKELRAHAMEILQKVADGERIAITHYGRVVAHIVPAPRRRTPEEMDELLGEVEEIRDAIEEAHPGPVDAAALVSEGRRW